MNKYLTILQMINDNFKSCENSWKSFEEENKA